METQRPSGDVFGATDLQNFGSAPPLSSPAARATDAQELTLAGAAVALVRRIFSRQTLRAVEAAMAIRFWPPK